MQSIDLNNRESFEQFRNWIIANSYCIIEGYQFALNGVVFLIMPDVIVESGAMWLTIIVQDRKSKITTDINYILEIETP